MLSGVLGHRGKVPLALSGRCHIRISNGDHEYDTVVTIEENAGTPGQMLGIVSSPPSSASTPGSSKEACRGVKPRDGPEDSSASGDETFGIVREKSRGGWRRTRRTPPAAGRLLVPRHDHPVGRQVHGPNLQHVF